MADYRSAGVWSGKDKGRGGAFSVSFSSSPNLPTCLLDVQFDEIDELDRASNMLKFMLGLLDIWPLASSIEVGPFRYYTRHQVFPKRLGAGWMLYLPKPITRKQLPEAADLVPVTKNGKQQGTIVVSISEGPFSIENSEHIKIANAIELRLADQDLLPR